MAADRLTEENFDRTLRSTLRFKHGFDHDALEQTKGIIADAAAHLAEEGHTKLGISHEHMGRTLKFLEDKHHGWKALPEHKRAHIEAALKDHFGIADES